MKSLDLNTTAAVAAVTLVFFIFFIYFARNGRTVKFQCTKRAGIAGLKALIGDLYILAVGFTVTFKNHSRSAAVPVTPLDVGIDAQY